MILTFHTQSLPGGKNGGSVMLPAYYLVGDYEVNSVHIHASTAPKRDAQFRLLADGVSIIENRTVRTWNPTTGVETTGADRDYVELSADKESEEYLDNFDVKTISGWITCNCKDSGDGKDFTVVLDVSPLDEAQE
jgi:hypothetical protein